jgi:hypothetical protein
MHLKDKRSGERIAPLERVTLLGANEGTVSVKDGMGREYVRTPASPALAFTVGGALGYHQVTLEDAAGHVQDTLAFRVAAQTRINDAGGEFSDLLQMLYHTMAGELMPHYTRYQGRLYFYLVGWLRDHVHTMKGIKYFAGRLKDGIDLYRNSQREDGMIWDNVHRREPPSTAPNHWAVRFRYGGFERTFEDGTAQFTRIPIENDVEYLFVEGLYYTWKATGDDGWMAATLDAAIRALEYSVTSPYRWSQKYGLLKRGHTIDTWDFQNDEDCLSDFVGWPDPMAVHPDKTHFGIMFGDNTGYAAACDYLAEMLEHVGRSKEALVYRERGQGIRQRLDALAWNGRFFTHHVPEQEGLTRDLGVDEAGQVSLSNAYSLNRRISHEQCVAIIQTYLDLKDHLPPGSPGEWYTIYPPFQKGYGGHNAIWQYMNASVTPIVAGELAHGAFEHGFEGYAVDILRRLSALGKQHGGVFHCSYTGAFLPPPPRQFTRVNLAPYANMSASLVDSPEAPDWRSDEHANLLDLPKGEQVFGDVPFLVLEGNVTPSEVEGHVTLSEVEGPRGCIGLSERPGYIRQVEIPLGIEAASIYFLHVLARTEGGVGGTITLHYADGSSFSQYVVEGENALPISHWLYLDVRHDEHDKRRARVVWHANHPRHLNQFVVAYGLDNPHPEKEISHVTLKAADTRTMWFVLGLTLCDAEVYFKPGLISFGIPNGWGAAAVVYALIEGLAGVVDSGVAYDRVALSPRWTAAGIDQADVVVHYPDSTGYAAYRYRHDPQNATITIELTGSGETCACHVLLPAEAGQVLSVRAGDEPLDFACTQVEHSRYVDFMLSLAGPRHVTIHYATGNPYSR